LKTQTQDNAGKIWQTGKWKLNKQTETERTLREESPASDNGLWVWNALYHSEFLVIM
jgi:hypothetical protein